MAAERILRCLRVRMIFMNCFLLGWSEKIVSKFRINILLQHRELYTTDLQYLAVESFQIKVLAKAVLFGSA